MEANTQANPFLSNTVLSTLFRESTQILNESSNKPYYDEAADVIACSNYYKEISFEQNSPNALFKALSKLISETHINYLEYKPAIYLYNWVDLRPNSLKIQSIYSGTDVDPETLILADLRILAEREKQMEAIGLPLNNRNSFLIDLELLEAFDAIEKENPFNCEHVVPQSWFDKKSPMRGDLHHLFSCIEECNRFRAHYPFYDFTKSGIQDMEECGSRDVTLGFEPKFGKGAVARATLYFILRYPDIIKVNFNIDKEKMLSTLLDWHNQEPVTDYEQHRNVAIQELQGNRNPFIDFPDLSSKVDLIQGLD